MITKSMINSLFASKTYQVWTIRIVHTEPQFVGIVFDDPTWFKAMKDEYTTLLKNETWVLVPYTPIMHVVEQK